MFTLFIKGGPIMWPLLVTSIVSLSVIIERALFLFRERRKRDAKIVEKIIQEMKQKNIKGAISDGQGSEDFVARTLVTALNEPACFSSELVRLSTIELKRFSRGLTTLDTIITLAPLLGLLGTVTGMIHAFGLLGMSELEAPTAITGGIAEALIATGFGLAIAICTLIPFNYLNSTVESVRHELEDIGSRIELLLNRPRIASEFDECIHYGTKQVLLEMVDEN